MEGLVNEWHITHYLSRAIGIQLTHAGRKGSKDEPWLGEKLLTKQENGYETIAPSSIAFDEGSFMQKQMDKKELNFVKESFVKSAKMAKQAGFDFIELHMAHGYLLHEFLSPLSNTREDGYGGKPAK